MLNAASQSTMNKRVSAPALATPHMLQQTLLVSDCGKKKNNKLFGTFFCSPNVSVAK